MADTGDYFATKKVVTEPQTATSVVKGSKMLCRLEDMTAAVSQIAVTAGAIFASAVDFLTHVVLPADVKKREKAFLRSVADHSTAVGSTCKKKTTSNLQPVVVEAAAKTVGANIPLASRSGPGMRCSVSGTVTEMLQNACENAADYHVELSAAMTIEAEHRWGGPPSDSKAVTSAAFTAFYGRERLVPASRAIRAAAHTEDDDNADEAARSSAAAKLIDLLADCREEDMDIDVLPRPSTRHGKGKCRHDCTDAAHGHDAAASGSSDARPRRGRSAATAKGDEDEDEDDEDEDEDEDDDSVPRMPLPPAKELRSVWAQVRAPPPPPGQHPDLLRGMRAAAERVGLMATAESAATDLAAKEAAYMAAVAALPSSKAAVQAAKAAAKGRRSAASAAELAAVKAKREEAVEAVAATRDARDAAARQVARFRDAADADDRLQKDEDAAYAALAKAEKAQAAAEADTDADRFRAAVAAEEKARAALLRARGEYLARLVRPYMPDVPCNNTARDSQPLTYLTLMVPLLRTIDAYAQETDMINERQGLSKIKKAAKKDAKRKRRRRFNNPNPGQRHGPHGKDRKVTSAGFDAAIKAHKAQLKADRLEREKAIKASIEATRKKVCE